MSIVFFFASMLGLFLYVLSRIGYPYDLEWMEDWGSLTWTSRCSTDKICILIPKNIFRSFILRCITGYSQGLHGVQSLTISRKNPLYHWCTFVLCSRGSCVALGTGFMGHRSLWGRLFSVDLRRHRRIFGYCARRWSTARTDGMVHGVGSNGKNTRGRIVSCVGICNQTQCRDYGFSDRFWLWRSSGWRTALRFGLWSLRYRLLSFWA